MNRKVRLRVSLFSLLVFILTILAISTPALAFESDKPFDIEEVNVVDCPLIINQDLPSKTVLQVIDNTFHKWREYSLGEDGELCIFLEEPEKRPLTAEESRDLLIASKSWMQEKKAFKSEDAVIVDPETLPQYESIMPHVDGPRPDWVDDNISDEPDTSISRSDYLGGQDSADPTFKEYNTEIENGSVTQTSNSGDDTDDRVRVVQSSGEEYPYYNIGFVGVYYEVTAVRGTGFLVSPHTVLTNAHVIYNSDFGGWPSDIVFFPGQYQAYEEGPLYRPFGERYGFDAEIPASYVEYEDDLFMNNPYDYGAFFIETAFEDISTFMPLEFDNNPSDIFLAGYPAEVHEETNSFAMWLSFGSVIQVLERELEHLATASGGNSGGPLWVYNEDTGIRRVVGLHAQNRYNSFEYYAGPRLTSHNKELIEEWMQWKPKDEVPPQLSDNADLSGLTVSVGILNPAFDADTTGYSVDVAYDVESLNITAALSDDNASMTINGDAATSGETKSVTLGEAGTSTAISIVVTAEDGFTEKLYYVIVNREEEPDQPDPGADRTIDSVVADVDGTLVEVALDEYAIAFFEGEGNQLFDYLRGEREVPLIYAIRSDDKYIHLAEYAENYLGDVSDAIENSEPLPESEIDDIIIYS